MVLVDGSLQVRKKVRRKSRKKSRVHLLPAGAHVLVAASHVLDVVFHDPYQGLVVVVASSDPRRELRVPDKSVAVDFLLIGLGPVAVAVGVAEGEVVAVRLNGLPLHCILWRERVEVGVVASNGFFGLVAATGILKSAKKSKSLRDRSTTYSVRAAPINSLPRAFIAVAKPFLSLGAEGWATAEAASVRAVKTSVKRILRLFLLSKRELLVIVHDGSRPSPLYIRRSSGYTGKLVRGRGWGELGKQSGAFPRFEPCR
jgi:hypothetical protein